MHMSGHAAPRHFPPRQTAPVCPGAGAIPRRPAI